MAKPKTEVTIIEESARSPVEVLALAPFSVAGSSTSSCEDGTHAQFGGR